jgi:hypothetical protein
MNEHTCKHCGYHVHKPGCALEKPFKYQLLFVDSKQQLEEILEYIRTGAWREIT